jgi:dihydrofolate reductase
MISCIVAAADNDAIGRGDGEIPWRLKTDFAHFKRTTDGHPIIMGRKTLPSMGNKPLPNRTNIVLTRDASWTADGFVVAHDIESALAEARQAEGNNEIFVCGGGEVYAAMLPLASRIYLTRVHTTVPDANAFFHFDGDEWHTISSELHPADPENQDEFPFTIITLERPA